MPHNLTPFTSREAEYHYINSNADALIRNGDIETFETFDTIYRALCAMLYNYAPLSGHPGGSISSGRFVTTLLYNSMKYDFSYPARRDADILSYAAGHKALGLYAHYALRNEIIRIAAPHLLPANINEQLRLEDLLGFRRNPVTDTPLFKQFKVKALDGHPTPATPFVKLSTGASGVGFSSSAGLAFAASDLYGDHSPVIHVVEGEAGLTPGRVAETLAAVSTASLKNMILHIDWNQSSIDSNAVCREGKQRGDYVQWAPAELTYLHNWNTLYVEDGKDFRQIIAAQQKALVIPNQLPTAIVYRTVKGWNYGIEGNKSHGSGHTLCSAGFYKALMPLLALSGKNIELCKDEQLCKGGKETAKVEQCFWDALLVVRDYLETNTGFTNHMAEKVIESGERLNKCARKTKFLIPDVNAIYTEANNAKNPAEEMKLKPGTVTTLRGELGKVLQHYNKISNGAILTSAADLLGSTSVNNVGKDFADGYFHATDNPASRTLSIGGICEDAMAGVMSGVSAFGNHIGVCSSYGAFIIPLSHIASRLHAIGEQAKRSVTKQPYNPFIVIAAHAGIKTGEDGPTHADPQPLQLIQENFPAGTAISLTPWEPQEIWPLMSAAFKKRPAVIYPFVTRPSETVIDRHALGLAPATDAVNGVYILLKTKKHHSDGVVVLQGSEVAYAFVQEALPLLIEEQIQLDVYYIASAELFNLLTKDEQENIFPESDRRKAIGITGFTLPTLYRWVTSENGRNRSLYPFKQGHFLGSGKAEIVVQEAGLDGRSQFIAIREYVKALKKEQVNQILSE
jgi:transketolase